MTSGGRGQVLEVLPAELVPAAEAAEAHWAPPSRRGTAAPQTGLAARFSGATLRAYQADWSTFASWCGARDVAVPPAPAEQVAIYLAAAASATRSPHADARYRAATVARWASSISTIHTSLGYPDPCAQPPARDVVAAIRGLREQASRHARPLLAGDLAVLLDCLPSPCWPGEPACRRDRLCVTLGFAAGLGPSALTGLTLADIEPASGSHALSVLGRTIGPAEPVLACPACAYASWRRLIDAVDDCGGFAAAQGMTGGDATPAGTWTCLAPSRLRAASCRCCGGSAAAVP